ncbi:MAG TPA: DegQ family serine endoprotease [Bryobacteraceae bacterium]|nr:DegQ family serine endoprotease [Bryobacteraceae bacterium]
MTRRYSVTWKSALAALVIAVCAGGIAGSLTTAKTGRSIPILMAAEAPGTGSRVSFEAGFEPVAKAAVPAVVNVSSSKIIRTPASEVPSPFFSDPFFRQFFGNQSPFDFQTPPSVEREHSLGSGVIVNPDGYILTNNHVISGAKDVRVLLGDKREFSARIIGADPKTDLAVLKINATHLPVLAFGDSSKLEVGNFVLAIGNPFGLNQTVTLGIVSAKGRGGLGIEDYEDFIQTDAAINPGNSGGALVDERGNLVGINTAILSGGSGGNEGIGFAIPVNMARGVMDQILKYGKVNRAWLGVSIQPVTQDMAQSFGLKENYGALVSDIQKGSPAAQSGIERGDIILDINGQKVQDSRALQLQIGSMSPGSTARLTVFRNGATREITVRLGEMPSGTTAGRTQNPAPAGRLRGISVGELTPDAASQLQLPSGTQGVVITKVDPASPAADAGLQQGDVIQEVNRHPVSSVAQYERAMQEAGNRPVLLLVNRNGETSFRVVQPQ